MRAAAIVVNMAVMAGAAGDARRRATVFAVTVLGLLLVCRLSNVLISGAPAQVPFTVALFVLPLLCAALAGLGLSAIALKADLITALIGRDDSRAAAELEEMTRICAAAHAEIRQVTGEGAPMSLARVLHAAREILTSAGIEVRAGAFGQPLPAAAEEVLVPVLREAVINIVRHTNARTCTIELTQSVVPARLTVGNDGISQEWAAGQPSGGGRGLANMRARTQAAGGWLRSGQVGDRFTLTAEIPLTSAGPVLAWPADDGHHSPLSGIRSGRWVPVARPLRATRRTARPDRGWAALAQVAEDADV